MASISLTCCFTKRASLLLILLAYSTALRGSNGVKSQLNLHQKLNPARVSNARTSEYVTGTRSKLTASADPNGETPNEDAGDAETLDFGGHLWKRVSEFKHSWTHKSTMPVFFGVGMLLVFLCAIVDFRTRSRADPESDVTADSKNQEPTLDRVPSAHSVQSASSSPPVPAERSILVITCLTSYRFFTGFLAATWVPFLIAREGDNLIYHPHWLSTASFMGVCKLIYGFSIALNPFFGLLSDRLAATAPWGGRSSFLIAGISLGCVGIYAAKLASESQDLGWYLVSSCLWMVGEAMADITTETVPPEMLPPSQYDLASSIRSVHQLMGCVVGYIALIVAAAGELSWHWLYVAYLGLMILSALPTLACMRTLHNDWRLTAGRGHTGPLLASIWEAYIAPTRHANGFARACLATCFFSLGTGPLFFTFLILHDLVGLDNDKAQQLHFSGVSICFLVGAVLMAIGTGVRTEDENGPPEPSRTQFTSDDDDPLSDATSHDGGISPGRECNAPDAGAGPQPKRTPVDNRWSYLFWSTCGYALTCAYLPFVSTFAQLRTRLVAIYCTGLFLGIFFGSVYSRFQACTWTLIPPRADIANAMGFMAVAKCTGAGLGNFIAGCMLDSFRGIRLHYIGGGTKYGQAGYFVMCLASAFSAFVAAGIVLSIARKRRALICGSGLRKWFCIC